jgi:hypothetical protein
MGDKGLFKGFSRVEELTMDPRLMCAVLAEQLARTNVALMAISEELKQVKENKENKE